MDVLVVNAAPRASSFTWSAGRHRRARRRLRPGGRRRPPRRPRRAALRGAGGDRRQPSSGRSRSFRSSLRSTTAVRWKRSAGRARRCPTSLTSRCSIPPSIAPCLRRHRPTRSRSAGGRNGTCTATASTASPCSGSPRRSGRERLVVCHLGGGCSVTAVWGREIGRHDDGILAARGRADGRPAPAPSTPAHSSTCSASSC